MFVEILFIFIFYLASGLVECSTEALVFNRVRITNNLNKQSSVRMHGFSPELMLLHAVLRFSSDINIRHPSMLLDVTSISKYSHIIQDETKRLTIVTRDVQKTFSFYVVDEKAIQDANNDGINDKMNELIQSMKMFSLGGPTSSGASYDAVLLLDEYSSIWDDYNIMIFERGLLTFESREEASLLAQERSDYSGSALFQCDFSFDSDTCLVNYTLLTINGRVYSSTYRIIIDLDSPDNFLPIELYLLWHRSSNHSLSIELLDKSTSSIFYLNQDFTYSLHEENTIILGVGLLHHFPCVEYSQEMKQFRLWYHKYVEESFVTQETIETILLVFNALLFYCLYQWVTSQNYHILRYIIYFEKYAKKYHFFAYKQLITEILAMITGFSIIVISIAFTEGGYSVPAEYEQRKILCILYIFYHSIVNIVIIVVYKEPNKATWQYYITRQKKPVLNDTTLLKEKIVGDSRKDKNDTKELYDSIMKYYHDPTVKISTIATITRNLTVVSNVMASLLLSYNFFAQTNDFYLLLMIIVSFTLIYFQVKYIAIGIFYSSVVQQQKESGSGHNESILFHVFIIVEIIILTFYIISSYNVVFVTYFNLLNSTYSEMTVHAYIVCALCAVILGGLLMVNHVHDEYLSQKEINKN